MVNKAEDFVTQVKKIVGDKFDVEVAELSGSLKVKKNDKIIFRIFKSMVAGDFIVRLDSKDHNVLAKKVADELGIGFVD